MESALARASNDEIAAALRSEFGPFSRTVAARYFESVRFPPEAEAQLRALHTGGFVVHVMKTTGWVNFLYLTWAMVRRGLPPVRAVFNLRPWLARPWRRTAQRGELDVRFTYARRRGGSGLVFLKQAVLGSAEGRYSREDPFRALVSLARKSDRPVYLVPELFVWEKRGARLTPSVWDRVFGSPEAPGFLHSLLAFWRNYQRAQFRVGEPIDLRKFVLEAEGLSDAHIARKVRGTLYHHLARETRAVFGPPLKPTERLIEETLRDRALRKTLHEHATAAGRPADAIQDEARRNLGQIAARFSPTLVGVSVPLFTWVFQRIYEGIEVDEPGLERALKAAAKSPIVLCPSHKSHVDYLILTHVLWTRGYTAPLVAAGANLSFFPLGWFLRRAGAFFLRRSFKDDVVYAAAFKAYIKKLVTDGVHQEFFPEGGRSRNGKLLQPKLGMFTWEVDAVLEGAQNDLTFIPVSIDYEKVVESGSYSKELGGGEKKPEDLKGLIAVPKILSARYGRIHLSFDEPVSVVELMKSRGLSPGSELPEETKRGLVRALANRVMYGISRVATLTPHSLVSAVLLSHDRPGIAANELAVRLAQLRGIAITEKGRLSPILSNAPMSPVAPGPVREALSTFIDDGFVRTQEVKGEPFYQVAIDRRVELSFYKNNLMNLVAPRCLVVTALGPQPAAAKVAAVKDRALFLSRLFKLEFTYRTGLSFDAIFAETVGDLVREGLLVLRDDELRPAEGSDVSSRLTLIRDFLRDFLESYLIAFLTLEDLAKAGALDRKSFVRSALETGRAELLGGGIARAEALSRTTIENAISYLLERGVLKEDQKLLRLSEQASQIGFRQDMAAELRRFLSAASGSVP